MAKCKENGCVNEELSLTEYCWEHLKEKQRYVESLLEWQREGKSMANFNLKGLSADSLRFVKTDLKGANLSLSLLTRSDFSGADLTDASLIGANLSESDFIGAECRGCDFMMSNLGKVRFWHADLESANFVESYLQKAEFLNSRLFNADFFHAELKDAKFLSQDNFKDRHNRAKVKEDNTNGAKESYATLKNFFIANSRSDDISWASYNENRMRLKKMWKENKIGFIPFFLMGLLSGWGEKPARAVLSSVIIISLYAFLYSISDCVRASYNSVVNLDILDYLYYSLITFTTVGYGDFIPKPSAFAQLLAASEGFIGMFMMGLFVFTMGRRYAAR